MLWETSHDVFRREAAEREREMRSIGIMVTEALERADRENERQRLREEEAERAMAQRAADMAAQESTMRFMREASEAVELASLCVDSRGTAGVLLRYEQARAVVEGARRDRVRQLGRESQVAVVPLQLVTAGAVLVPDGVVAPLASGWVDERARWASASEVGCVAARLVDTLKSVVTEPPWLERTGSREVVEVRVASEFLDPPKPNGFDAQPGLERAVSAHRWWGYLLPRRVSARWDAGMVKPDLNSSDHGYVLDGCVPGKRRTVESLSDYLAVSLRAVMGETVVYVHDPGRARGVRQVLKSEFGIGRYDRAPLVVSVLWRDVTGSAYVSSVYTLAAVGFPEVSSLRREPLFAAYRSS